MRGRSAAFPPVVTGLTEVPRAVTLATATTRVLRPDATEPQRLEDSRLDVLVHLSGRGSVADTGRSARIACTRNRPAIIHMEAGEVVADGVEVGAELLLPPSTSVFYHRGGFLLLDRTPDGTFAQLAEAWSGRVRAVPDDHATPTGVLVRPDGVVARASDTDTDTDTADVAGLEAALHRWAGAPSSSPQQQPAG
ncbi:hypothetical protein [Streptomyces sp. GESEQ-35]|uniref:aromatic-ring hydroxylase C-terminal domain-containing protein n=1 Tax=Streptomyces sp. GESEQ-35 TaxID=2812657 RepID=UPI0027E328AF|nr:hypothetical protein [Streptomyces sp. GESEQ-35]